MPTCPKPQPRPPKPKSRLKAKTKLKAKYKSTPNKHLLIERDGPFCKHPGCCENGTDDHHIVFRSHADQEWQDDLRNRFLLCRRHHRLAHEKVVYRLYLEALGVAKFGWWAGKDMTVDDWVDINGLRLQKASLDVEKLIREIAQG